MEELPRNRRAPIYHEPGTMTICSVEELKKLCPNSFDRLGSLKREYDIKLDPIVPPVQSARRKVPIGSKEPIGKELDYLLSEEIMAEQIDPTP